MRNLNEYKAEIFSRSEKRIKKRKKARRRALALGMTLCLVLTVWSVTALPSMLSAGEFNETDKQVSENGSGNASGNSVSLVSISITGSEQLKNKTQTVTDPHKVTDIHRAVLDLFNQVKPGGTATNDNSYINSYIDDNFKDATENGNSYDENRHQNPDYTICFKFSDGSETEFSLNGNTLYDVNNDNLIYLSEIQLEEITECLQLTD